MSLKRDIKRNLSVPDFYRKLGDEWVSTDNPTNIKMTMEERQHLKDLHYQYAKQVEDEEKKSLSMYKKRSYQKRRK